MRDAADDVDAHVQRPDQVLARTRRAVEAVLGEGHELQRQVGCDPPLDLEQRLDAGQAVVADVDMAADGADALRHRHVAIGQRPLDHRLDGELRLQLVPELDALEQRAGAVQARQAQRQGGVHVEVAVDEGRRHQPARHVELVPAAGVDLLAHRLDQPVGDQDVVALPAVGQVGAAKDQVRLHGAFRA